MRRLALGFISVLLGSVLAIGVAEITSRAFFPFWSEFSSERFTDKMFIAGVGSFAIGRPQFDGIFSQNNGDFRIGVRINAAGFRNEASAKEANQRVWYVGDSFTFGWGVERHQFFGAVAENSSGWPAYNIASPGADVCGYQALVQLAKLRGAGSPKAIIVGLTIENDIVVYDCETARRAPPPAEQPSGIPRSLGQLKGWLTDQSALYNFFTVTVKRSPALRSGFEKIGLISQVHNLEGAAKIGREQMDATVHELAHLRDIIGDRIPIAVLLIPSRAEWLEPDGDNRQTRAQLTARLSKHSIAVIDPTSLLLKSAFTSVHFPHDGHWSPNGHTIVGKMIGAWLVGWLGRGSG